MRTAEKKAVRCPDSRGTTEGRLFSRICGDRARGNGFKSWFDLDIKEKNLLQ